MEFKSLHFDVTNCNNILDDGSHIIICVSPSCNLKTKKGSCRIALIFNHKRKLFNLYLDDVESANRCAILGLTEGAKHITQPKDIIFVTAASFGFKKAIKFKGINHVLWNDFFRTLEINGCTSITEAIIINGGVIVSSWCS